jgi:membrane protein DedA with SNARE-associated domain
MSDLVNFVIRHGEALVFVYVFADQIGVPLPAVPALLAMGALAAVDKLNFAGALLLSVLASLLADTIWYTLGRTRGSRVLRLLCKISPRAPIRAFAARKTSFVATGCAHS